MEKSCEPFLSTCVKSIDSWRWNKTVKLYNFIERSQGNNARKVNCGCVYSAYILKPVLSGRNL